MTRLFLQLAALCLLAHFSCAQNPTIKLSEDAVFRQFILPVAQGFARLPGLPLEKGIEPALIRHWEIHRMQDSREVVSATISLTKWLSLDLIVRQTNAVVCYFGDMRINAHSIAGDDDPTKARFYSKQPDQFTLETAREFATAFFQAAGHKPENFRLWISWQLGWGAPKDKANYIPLPFYEFDWLRKDVKEVKPGEIYHPRVRVVVSGLDRRVLMYMRMNLPVTGDFDEPPKQP